MGKDSQVANAEQDQMAHIRLAVRQLCAKYGEDYWLNMDRSSGYPSDSVAELTASGFLGVLIPEQYGGSGLGLAEACVVMEEICRSGAHAGVCHAQMYVIKNIFFFLFMYCINLYSSSSFKEFSFII